MTNWSKVVRTRHNHCLGGLYFYEGKMSGKEGEEDQTNEVKAGIWIGSVYQREAHKPICSASADGKWEAAAGNLLCAGQGGGQGSTDVISRGLVHTGWGRIAGVAEKWPDTAGKEEQTDVPGKQGEADAPGKQGRAGIPGKQGEADTSGKQGQTGAPGKRGQADIIRKEGLHYPRRNLQKVSVASA